MSSPSRGVGRVQHSDCCWPHCNRPPREDLPICNHHVVKVYGIANDELRTLSEINAEHTDEDRALAAVSFREQGEIARRQQQATVSVVYYLRLGPFVVKIGTTTNLHQRVRQLRSEMQYVMATEPGGRDLEHKRHVQFAEERINRRREDFSLSSRLQEHIDLLRHR